VLSDVCIRQPGHEPLVEQRRLLAEENVGQEFLYERCQHRIGAA